MGHVYNMSAINVGDALELITKADKKSKSFWPGSSKYEDAFDMYNRAGNMLKVAKHWDEAGAAYEKAAAMADKLGEGHEAATALVSAAGVYKKTDTARAVTVLQTAAQFYEGENSAAMATKCLLKVALFSAQLERYDRAIEIYTDAGISGTENHLTQFKCKEYFLHAVLCHMATGEFHTARSALERFLDVDPKFVGSREAVFAEQLVDACEESDVEAFTLAIVEFDRISKLSHWRTTILLRVKNAIKEDNDDLT